MRYKMARRRKTRTVRARSYSPFRRKTRSKSRKSVSKVNLIQFDSMLYGAVRGYTSDLLEPLVRQIPLGNIADEVALGTANYFIAKNTKGMIKNVALKGLTIENARLGEAVVSGSLGNLFNKSNAKQSNIASFR
jgi:hypothetical protein